ncbi:MAG: B12-binding domain-containing radical SAM protein [Deltaproteobacteria bacterium]|nr:B12-binding domain-containing radical SAM protein [Deltaproteobacteria bacterium]
MKKIVFIEPKPSDLHVFTRAAIPRLGTVLLGTILKKHGYNVLSCVETIEELDLKDVLTADLVGISCITATARRSYEIAMLLRQAGVTVFIGGPHATFLPDEALQYCDFVIRGEADDCIVDFVKAVETGKGLEQITGLSYRDSAGRVTHNRETATCKNVDSLPCPDFTLIKGLETHGLKKFPITPIMTSRGCPFDCSFCSVTGMFGQKYRFRNKENVIKELENHRNFGGDWVFFYDDNFIAHKKRTKELLSAMIEKKLTFPWTAQVRVDVARDQELMDLMKRSKCNTVYIGFESINPETLKLYNKKQSLDDIETCIKLLHKNGTRIHGMFVFGADTDTTGTIHETIRFAKKNNLETVQFLILTPLPGTRCYSDLEKEGRIISKDWSLYDAHHVVFEPKLMSYYELQSETMQATKEFYSIPQIIKRAVKLDLFNVALKTYGRNVSRKWSKKNEYFVEYTKTITNAGRNIELAAKKTAEDIKEKFAELHLSGAVIKKELV